MASQSNPFATAVPAKERFREAAAQALEQMSDATLNFMSFRMEAEFEIMARHNGQGVLDIPEEVIDKEIDELLRHMPNEAAPKVERKRQSRNKRITST
jgi:hypothetical protein